jgi:uncharacterized protein
MSIFRGLIVILIVWLAFVLARQLYRSYRRQHLATRQQAAKGLAVTVIRCDRCGVHVPQQEALSSNGRYYCSSACLQGRQDS